MEELDFMPYVIKKEDGYHLVTEDGESKVCKIIEDGRTICLPKNSANRQFIAVKRVEAALEAGEDKLVLEPRDPATNRKFNSEDYLPNKALIAYLSEEEQEEYKAIIKRAIAARAAAKKDTSTMSDKEKILAKIEKLKAKLAATEDALGE